MSRTTFIILVIVLTLIVIAVGVWFFFIYQGPKEGIRNIGTEIIDRLPFGGGFGGGSSGTDTGGIGDGGIKTDGTDGIKRGTTSASAKIRMLSQIPVAGFGVVEATSTTATVRYLERASGNVYEIGPEEANARRITNTTIPRIHEAIFTQNGAGVIIRYLRDDNKTIETYSASIPPRGLTSGLGQAGEQNNELKGVFLPQNISTLSVSPDGKRIFYIIGFGGGTLGFVSNTLNENKQQIFNSPLTEWLVSWPQEKTISLTTKPSGGIAGYLFSLNPATKVFEKILGGTGLTTLISPNGKLILLSNAGVTGIALGVYDIKNKTTLALGPRTLSEKCVWTADSAKIYCAVPADATPLKLPDTWYQGRFFFSDRIWLIDPNEGNSSVVADLRRETGKNIDVTNLSIEKRGNNLFFINKIDQSLWSIRLGE